MTSIFTNPAGHAIHIIGIGGIGTSAVAQWLQSRGARVQGSDAVASDITSWLSTHTIEVFIGPINTFESLPDLVIYSDAVPPTHPLRVSAAVQKIPEYSYAQALGMLSQQYRTIAITGSHGKSTTTALTGLLVEALGLDPVVVVGTRVPQWQSAGQLGNFRPGRSDILVVEADEYRRHFHELTPAIATITSLDHDHVDSFPTAQDYQVAFEQFIDRVVAEGTVIVEQAVAEKLHNQLQARNFITYTSPLHATHPPQTIDSTLHLTTSPIVMDTSAQKFTVRINHKDIGPLFLKVPGVHMVGNFLAALGVGLTLTKDESKVMTAAAQVAENFHGTWRRFEAIGTFNGALAFSDYAHHPTELAALIDAAHQFYPDRRLIVVLQPHHHNRARAFTKEFIDVLSTKLNSADQVVLCEVYGVVGRENTQDAVTTQDWVKKIGPRSSYVPSLSDLQAALTPLVQPQDIVIFTGAGDIDGHARKIVKK